jgi:endo-alpha-1,4-polygalactosaminidase (GH114 family)
MRFGFQEAAFMSGVENFFLQLGNLDGSEILDSGYDLLIVETGITSTSNPGFFDSNELASLNDPDRTSTVIGYVNLSVTDDARQYWLDEVGPIGDVGPFPDGVPPWLEFNFGTADFPTGQGTIVDYRDPAWQQIVIDQAVAVVAAGFDGVFLDDMGRYFEAQENVGTLSAAEAAIAMMDLVNRVAEAIGPDSFVAVNGSSYILNDSGIDINDPNDPNRDIALAFLENVDALMMENQANPGSHAWQQAFDDFGGSMDFLAVEDAATLDNPETLAQMIEDFGLLPFISPTVGYDEFVPREPGTSPPPFTIIVGSQDADDMLGTSGDDFIFALGGNDTVDGLGGNDTIIGGDGGDWLIGGPGADVLDGGALTAEQAAQVYGSEWIANNPGTSFTVDDFTIWFQAALSEAGA